MGAPTMTARTAPTGTKLKDGHKITKAFAANAAVNLWEKVVMPPGADGGEPVDQTTQFNATYRTKSARTLKEITNASMTCAYDPAALSAILALVNVETSITDHFPDHSAWSYFGYLKSFKPGPIKEGEQPEAEVEIIVTNVDPSDNSEAGPVYTASGGTP